MWSALLFEMIISTVLLRLVQVDHSLCPFELEPANDPDAQRSQLLMLLFVAVAVFVAFLALLLLLLMLPADIVTK